MHVHCAQSRLRASEQASCQLVWSQADNWIPYFTTHMEAIRAKYFPTTVVKLPEVEDAKVALPHMNGGHKAANGHNDAVAELPTRASARMPPKLSRKLSVKVPTLSQLLPSSSVWLDVIRSCLLRLADPLRQQARHPACLRVMMPPWKVLQE